MALLNQIAMLPSDYSTVPFGLCLLANSHPLTALLQGACALKLPASSAQLAVCLN